MKKNTIQFLLIILLVLSNITLMVLYLSGKKSQEAAMQNALSRQRIEYEQKMITEREQFEITLQQQREAMEVQSDREAEWIAKDLKVDETVKNITTFLKVNVTFKDKLIGGVENVMVSVTNTSDFKMEQVTVKLSYLKKGTAYTTQNVTLYELQPRSTMTISAPNGPSGNSVTGVVYKVKSAALGHP